jgi:hypothetical protein
MTSGRVSASFDMSLLRVIITFFVLSAQALPVTLLAHEAMKEPCSRSCCAWLIKAGLAECECAQVPNTSEAPTPASLPPATSRSELTQTVWAEAPPTLGQGTDQSHELASLPTLASFLHFSPQPHVRLTVLFCSFLT